MEFLDLRHLIWNRQVGSIASDGAFLKAVSEDGALYYKMSAYNASIETIWKLIWERWRYAKKFCDMRSGD